MVWMVPIFKNLHFGVICSIEVIDTKEYLYILKFQNEILQRNCVRSTFSKKINDMGPGPDEPRHESRWLWNEESTHGEPWKTLCQSWSNLCGKSAKDVTESNQSRYNADLLCYTMPAPFQGWLYSPHPQCNMRSAAYNIHFLMCYLLVLSCARAKSARV